MYRNHLEKRYRIVEEGVTPRLTDGSATPSLQRRSTQSGLRYVQKVWHIDERD
jgi:hypothetical protein